MDSTTHDVSLVFIELGCVVVGLAVLARIANRWGFSAIPLYLLAGLAFGNGGLAPVNVSASFIHIGAEIGVLLLLFMLGLEYTARQSRNQKAPQKFVQGANIFQVSSTEPYLRSSMTFSCLASVAKRHERLLD